LVYYKMVKMFNQIAVCKAGNISNAIYGNIVP